MLAIIQTSPTVLSDRENMGITVKISLLSNILAEIYVIYTSGNWPPSLIYDLRQTQTSHIISITLLVLPFPETRKYYTAVVRNDVLITSTTDSDNCGETCYS